MGESTILAHHCGPEHVLAEPNPTATSPPQRTTDHTEDEDKDLASRSARAEGTRTPGRLPLHTPVKDELGDSQRNEGKCPVSVNLDLHPFHWHFN